MKRVIISLLVLICYSYAFCKPISGSEALVEQPAEILKNTDSFFTYWSTNVKLTEDFKGFDLSGHPITKSAFLKLLTTGKYLPVRLSTDGGFSYKLYNMSAVKNEIITESVAGWAQEFYVQYKREGQRFPAFNYVDLNGNLYNTQTTKGKIVVIKCWFVRCHNCILEMPDLNKLVNTYKNRKDVVFVSLAYDPEKDLKAFLKKTTFIYPVAHMPQKYLDETLAVRGYPTHFIINKRGVIAKVVSTADELASALKKETAM